MKKKIIISMICILMLSLFAGCGSEKQTAAKPKVKLTAQLIVDKLKAKESNYMTDITVVTADNDPNKLLGRPNEYTEKITWKDNRAKDSQVDCSVELFANSTDATARNKYLTAINKSLPMLNQYMDQKDKILLRIDGTLTPDQSKEYTSIFDAIK